MREVSSRACTFPFDERKELPPGDSAISHMPCPHPVSSLAGDGRANARTHHASRLRGNAPSDGETVTAMHSTE